MHTSREGPYQSCIKIGKIWNIGFLPFFFFAFIKMGPYGRKSSDDVLSESTQQICSPKFRRTPKKGLYQSCIKSCEISSVRFLANIFVSSAWLCQQRSWNRNLSVVRPSVWQLSLNLMHGFLSNFSFGFPCAIRSDMFEFFKTFFFVWVFSILVNMGPCGSKNFKTLLLLQSQRKVFKLFLNFLPNGPHKLRLGFFTFWKLKF